VGVSEVVCGIDREGPARGDIAHVVVIVAFEDATAPDRERASLVLAVLRQVLISFRYGQRPSSTSCRGRMERKRLLQYSRLGASTY